MHETFYNSLSAGIGEIKARLLDRCDVTVDSASLKHIIKVRPNDAVTLEFQYNEWYPSRVPRIRVKLNEKGLSNKSERELENALWAKAKGHEYLNTPMLPLLVGYVLDVVSENKNSREQINVTSQIFPDEDENSSTLVRFNEAKLPGLYAQPRDFTESRQERESSLENQWIGAGLSSSLWSGNDEQDDWPELCASRGNTETELLDGPLDTTYQSDGWTEISYNKKKQDEKKFTRKVTSAKDSQVEVPVKEKSKGKKSSDSGGSGRANYFVAVRCTNPKIGDALEEVVGGITSQNPLYKELCYDRNMIHVTLCTLALYSENQVKEAVDSLKNMEQQLTSNAPKDLLRIEGISQFNDGNVVYGQVHCPEDFLEFRRLLRRGLREEGVNPRDEEHDYTAHMTIAKTNLGFLKRNRKRNITNIPEHLYQKFKNMEFGSQKVEGIHLCKMGPQRRKDGFYTCPTEIIF